MKYETPEMNIIVFEETDVITNSNDNVKPSPWSLDSF